MKIDRLLLLIPLFVSAARAQEAVRLQEVQVVGNKEGRTYAETPESVTILPPQRLNRGDQDNSVEVLAGQSNVQVQSDRNTNSFSIRGVSSSGVTGFQKDNLASVFVDGVFQTDLALRAGGFEVWDLESLELHRGPQSTSQGVNSLAGAILLEHVKPHQDKEAALKLGYGSFNRREIGGTVNRAFLDDRLALRVSFNKDVNDGFIKNTTTGNDDWGRQDKGWLSAGVGYFFGKDHELRLDNKFLRTDDGGNYTVGANPFDYEVREDVDARNTTSNQQNALIYRRPVGEGAENKTTLAYTHGLQTRKSDADATPADTAGVRRQRGSDQFLSFENVLSHRTARVKNAFGVHAHRFTSTDHHDFAILLSGVPIRVVNDLDRQRETYAVFDSFLYKLDERHALNLGGRYEVVKNGYTSWVDPRTVTGSATVDAYLDSVRGNFGSDQSTGVFLPKIGYLFQLEAHTFGLTYSRGYRIGGLDINRSQAKTVEYAPEYTDNYEASWKYGSGRLQTQANVFYTHWQDQQVEVRFDTSDPYNTQVENAANSELYGAELEATHTWDGGDALRLGVGHVRTRFLSFTENDESYTGNEFPDAARWTAQAAWRHPFTDRLSTNLTLRHVGRSYTSADNEIRIPEQYYADVNLSWSQGDWVAELNAKNVTDQRYILNRTPVYDNVYKRVNRPREFGTRVTWVW